MHPLQRRGDSSLNTEQNTEFKMCETVDRAEYKQEPEFNGKLLRSLQERRYFQSRDLWIQWLSASSQSNQGEKIIMHLIHKEKAITTPIQQSFTVNIINQSERAIITCNAPTNNLCVTGVSSFV